MHRSSDTVPWKNWKKANERNQADVSYSFATNHKVRLPLVLQRFSLPLIEPIPRRDRGKTLENRRLKRAYRFYGNPPCGLGTKDKDCSCSRPSSLVYYLRSLGDKAVHRHFRH
jgi:hypothetical protein